MTKALCEALGVQWHPEMDKIFGEVFVSEYTHASTKGIVPRGKDAYWYGKTIPQESKEKNRLAHLGRKHKEETKEIIRAYRHTDEAKINISKNHYFAKNGRPGHGNVMKEFYKQHPEKSPAGKTWKKDPIAGKRVWVDKALAVGE